MNPNPNLVPTIYRASCPGSSAVDCGPIAAATRLCSVDGQPLGTLTSSRNCNLNRVGGVCYGGMFPQLSAHHCSRRCPVMAITTTPLILSQRHSPHNPLAKSRIFRSPRRAGDSTISNLICSHHSGGHRIAGYRALVWVFVVVSTSPGTPHARQPLTMSIALGDLSPQWASFALYSMPAPL